MADTIESREVRGINLKIIITTVVSIVAVCASVFGTYYAIVKKIDTQSNVQDNRYSLQELEMKQLKASYDFLSSQFKEQNIRLNDLEFRTRILERASKLNP